jgi:ADP-ribose pyrophosphatase YjhB (NUDIX family)
MENEISKFEVAVLGLIFDSTKKKILIVKREDDDKDAELLRWCFPGGRLTPGEDIDKALKKHIKNKTGYVVKNVGTFFSRTYEEKPEVVSISFLTKVFEGEEEPGNGIAELKWVKIDEIESHFKIPIHKKLKEFLLELV